MADSKQEEKQDLPTISIQGKDYVLVKDRVLYFNETYKNGCINTEFVQYQDNRVIMKATVTPNVDEAERYFTGYSQAVDGQGMVNKTAALENAETSAVGRALALMGIGVIDSIASADELHKAVQTPQEGQPVAQVTVEVKEVTCEVCGATAEEKKGVSKTGKNYHGVFCSTKNVDHTRWLGN